MKQFTVAVLLWGVLVSCTDVVKEISVEELERQFVVDSGDANVEYSVDEEVIYPDLSQDGVQTHEGSIGLPIGGAQVDSGEEHESGSEPTDASVETHDRSDDTLAHTEREDPQNDDGEAHIPEHDDDQQQGLDDTDVNDLDNRVEDGVEDEGKSGEDEGKSLDDEEKSLDDEEKSLDDEGAPADDEETPVDDEETPIHGEEPPVQEEEIPFEELLQDVKLNLLSPTEDQPVPSSFVDIHVHIDIGRMNESAFEDHFNNSQLCFSIDDSPFGCWPTFNISRNPRIANLQVGEHVLVANLVDPDTEEFLQSATHTTTFSVVEPAPEPTTQVANTDDADGEEGDADKEVPEEETVQIPVVEVTFPHEGALVTDWFVAELNIATTAEMDQFKRLFEFSYLCLTMNASPHLCWPVLEDKYFPKFAKLQHGMHRLKAELSHPSTGEIIPGSTAGTRRFWANHDESGTGDATAPRPTTPDVEIVVQVDGFERTIPIYRGDDFEEEALRFCVSQGIQEPNCVEAVHQEISQQWEATGQGEGDSG